MQRDGMSGAFVDLHPASSRCLRIGHLPNCSTKVVSPKSESRQTPPGKIHTPHSAAMSSAACAHGRRARASAVRTSAAGSSLSLRLVVTDMAVAAHQHWRLHTARSNAADFGHRPVLVRRLRAGEDQPARNHRQNRRKCPEPAFHLVPLSAAWTPHGYSLLGNQIGCCLRGDLDARNAFQLSAP